MKKNFTRIKSWFLAVSFAALLNPAIGAIIYHDEVPDVTQTQTTDGVQVFLVDMNGDLTLDFTLSVLTGDTTYNGIDGSGSVVAIKAENGSAIAQSTSTPASLASALNSGDDINSSLSWQTNTSILRFDGQLDGPPTIPVVVGNFTGSTDMYIGVRFTVGADTYYGWIRVAVSTAGDSYTIKDWAYEDVADAMIDAGATSTTNVNEQLASTTTIVNQNNVINLNFAQHLSGTVQVVNMNGSVVVSEKFNGKSCKINLQGKTSGIYSLLFETSSGEFAKKIYIE